MTNIRKQKIRNQLLPYIFFIGLFLLHLTLKIKKVTIRGPYLPLSYGIAKDVFDAMSVFIFPWNGWIVLLPLAMSIYLKQSPIQRVLIWAIGSMMTGILGALLNFDAFKPENALKGFFTYLFIFGYVWIFAAVMLYLLRKIKQCLW